MSKRLSENRRNEYPIVRLWYTRYEGLTIEQLIDKHPDFFLWMVSEFQNVTPAQAAYYARKTGRLLNPVVIENVEPYEYQKGDPEPDMYMELCETRDLQNIIKKYRGVQLNLFE